jgi:hypothetical protein
MSPLILTFNYTGAQHPSPLILPILRLILLRLGLESGKKR